MIAISSATSTSHVIFFAIKRQSTLAITTMVWESIHADDFRRKAPALHRRVVQVLNHAYTHVLKRQTNKDKWWGEFSINHATNDGSYTPYINVVRGSDHDISIDARRRTVKVNGQYKPLEGTAEHVSTLDDLCAWVRTHAEARAAHAAARGRRQVEEEQRLEAQAAQAAARAEARRRQEEERRRLEADPVWQEQQREAARRRRQAEEEAAAARAEQLRIAAERAEAKRLAAEEAKRAAWEAKARLLAAKVQSEPGTSGAPGGSATQNEQQVPQAVSLSEPKQPSEPAFQLVSCQECKERLQFCKDKGCTILLHGTCKCRQSSMHASLTKDMYEQVEACLRCEKKIYCAQHDRMDRCMPLDGWCEQGPFCSSCSDMWKCRNCGRILCSECVEADNICKCWVPLKRSTKNQTENMNLKGMTIIYG